MKILHTLTFPKENHIEAQLARIGIKSRDSIILNFQIFEHDTLWPKISELCAQYNPVDIVKTTFSRSELKQADHLLLIPSWHHGYPMLDDDFGFLNITFDTTDYCTVCGIGRQQNGPFRMKAEPKWGRRSILQLNWILDEYFVKPEVYANVFEPFGIPSLEVLHYKTNEPLTGVLQLILAETSQSLLEISAQPSESCPKCGRKKFLPLIKGPFPGFVSSPGCAQISKTQEIFGSGGSANKRVVVTQELYSAMFEAKVRGVEFHVIEKGKSNK